MFVRSCWKPGSEQDAYRIIEQYPWGLLVSNGVRGPFVTNLPFVLERSGDGNAALVSHLARANEHSDALLQANTPVLAVFQGPSSYVTSSWYPGRDMPPTYYYTAVHCYGSLTFQDERELQHSIEDLTARSEAKVVDGWKINEIPNEAVTRRLKAILGFRLHIDRMEAKFKLGQDEPKRDAMAVAERLLQSEDVSMRALGALVNDANVNRES